MIGRLLLVGLFFIGMINGQPQQYQRDQLDQGLDWLNWQIETDYQRKSPLDRAAYDLDELNRKVNKKYPLDHAADLIDEYYKKEDEKKKEEEAEFSAWWYSQKDGKR